MQFCSNCGMRNTPTAKFCATCGRPLAMRAAAGNGSPAPGNAPGMAPASSATFRLLRGRYRVVRLLSQGGMGAVYLAQDQNAFDRRCVVKEMLPYYSNLAEKQKAESDFEREARVLAGLRFDGVPQIYEYFIEGGKYYLVMEYVEGENLEERMARLGGKLPLDEALGFALQLANILVHLSKQTPPVIHRDIKPANIILDQQQGKLKLVDFGLAKEDASSDLSGTVTTPLGTPGYAPVEQYRGHVEPRTDVYSLGATLHHLLTGRDPRAETAFDFPPLRNYLPDASEELEELVRRMLSTRAAERPKAADVRDALEAMTLPQASILAANGASRPFAFRSGPVAHDAMEMALLCDRHWDDGIYHLYEGHFEAWLDGIGRRDLAVRAESIRRSGRERSAGLEEFLRAANPTIPLPSLAVSSAQIDLGKVERGKPVVASIRLTNAGRGCLYGRIVNRADWAMVRPQDFSLMPGEQCELSVTVQTGSFQEGPVAETAFELTSNGGAESIRCRMEVIWKPVLALEPQRRLHLGDFVAKRARSLAAPLVIRNLGGGVLQGRLATDASWLGFDTTNFRVRSGDSVTVQVLANRPASHAKHSSGVIRIETPVGTQTLLAHAGVREEWYGLTTRAGYWLIYGLLALVGYAGHLLPLCALMLWLMGYGALSLSWSAGLAALFALSPAALTLSRRWVARLDEIESFYHGHPLQDDLPTTRFSVLKLVGLTAAGASIGAMIGWRFGMQAADPDVDWREFGAAALACGGALLAWKPLPFGALSGRVQQFAPRVARAWGHVSAHSGWFLTAVRSVGLVLIGALTALMLNDIGGLWSPMLAALWGGAIGLLLGSDSHTFAAMRLRWMLHHLRVPTLIGVGAYLVALLAPLYRWGTIQWILYGYSRIDLVFLGLLVLAWSFLTLASLTVGAAGGLWAAGGTVRMGRAQALFLSLTGILAATMLPIYVLLSALGRVILEPQWADAFVVGLVAIALFAALLLLYNRRVEIEHALPSVGGLIRRGTVWLPLVRLRLPTQRARAQAQRVAGSIPAPVAATWNRARSLVARRNRPAQTSTRPRRFALPSLAEIEAELPLPAAMGAALLVLLSLPTLAQAVVSGLLGVGAALLVVLLAILAATALVMGLVMGLAIGLRRRRNTP